MTDEKMLDKVRKLLAQAEKAGSEAEAATYTAKATELMLRYSIDEAKLQKAGQKPNETIIYKRVTVKGYAKAKLSLLHGVAKSMGLHCVAFPNNRSGWSEATVEVTGWESDVASFEVLFASLEMQAGTEVERSFKNYKANGGCEHGRSYKQSFMIGFANTVSSRLRNQRTDTIKQMDDYAPGTALAVVDRNTAVEKAFERRYPKLGKASGASSSGWSGYAEGKSAGQRANIGGSSLTGGRKQIG